MNMLSEEEAQMYTVPAVNLWRNESMDTVDMDSTRRNIGNVDQNIYMLKKLYPNESRIVC